MLALIHPKTGDLFVAKTGDGALARHMILKEGYVPVGPKGRAYAALLRKPKKEA